VSVRPHFGPRLAAALAALSAVLAAPAAIAQPTMVSPGAGEALAPGAVIEVRWASLCDVKSLSGTKREIDEAEVVLSLDGGRTFPIRVTPELSPCATHFLWTVPALPTVHARLAVRAGSEERDATETLEILSGDFRILQDPDGRVEKLRRHVNEWWIAPPPVALSAEDLLERTMCPASGQIATPVSSFDAAIPTSPSPSLRPSRAPVFALVAQSAGEPSDISVPSRPTGSSNPLRL
jgi:hypothetical protein